MRRVILLTIGTCASASCAPALWEFWEPTREAPEATARIEPRAAWTDTGYTVRAGELLFFSATGDVEFDGLRVGPDGAKPWIGVRVGRGGLIGRIGPAGEPFDIGARTKPFKYPNVHSHRYHPPPPIAMPGAGVLFLGFKACTSGRSDGAFEVTIRLADRRSTR